MGDIYQGGFFNIVNFFYAIFLTDVVGISPFWAGAVFLVGKVWDAVTDPAMGIISDNTRSRFGRRRPYIILGAPLILIAFIMMWFPLSGGTEAARVIYYIFMFILMNTVTSIVSVPFLAMSVELSTDYDERTSISNIRLIVSIASTLICAVVPMLIVGMYQDIRTGYIVMSVVFALFFTLPMLMILKVPERKQFSGDKKGTWKEMFGTLRLKVFRKYIIMYLGIVVAMDVTAMIFAFFMTYNLGRAAELSFVLGTLLICEVLSIPLATKFASKTSKNRAVLFGSVGWMICAFGSLFVTAASPGFVVYVVAGAIGFSIAFALVGYTAMFGDVTEVGEYYFGYRSEGGFTGIQQFIRKVAAALANWVALTLLGIVGFINPLQVVENGVSTIILQEQTPLVIFTIRGILGIAPMLLLIPAVVIAARWKLSKGRHAVLVRYLDRKRAGLEIDSALEDEVRGICEPLI